MTAPAPPSRRRREAAALGHAIRPLATDLAATLSFYLVLAAGGSLVAATVSGIALGIAQLGWLLWRRRPVAPMQWAMLLIVGVVGGLTLALHDARVAFHQASLLYLIVGVAMLKPGWILRYVPPVAIEHLERRRLVAAGFAWAVLIIGSGLFNFALTLTQPVRIAAAVFGIWAPASKLALFAGQYWWFRAIVRRRMATAD